MGDPYSNSVHNYHSLTDVEREKVHDFWRQRTKNWAKIEKALERGSVHEALCGDDWDGDEFEGDKKVEEFIIDVIKSRSQQNCEVCHKRESPILNLFEYMDEDHPDEWPDRKIIRNVEVICERCYKSILMVPKDLKTLPAAEILRLMRLGHPYDKNEPYSRGDVMDEIDRRGFALLDELGWGHADDTPYWNRYTGNMETFLDLTYDDSCDCFHWKDQHEGGGGACSVMEGEGKKKARCECVKFSPREKQSDKVWSVVENYTPFREEGEKAAADYEKREQEKELEAKREKKREAEETRARKRGVKGLGSFVS